MAEDNEVVIGNAIRIKGKVRGAENLVLRGRIEGTVSLTQNHFTIEDTALLAGDADVENITVRGEQAGDSVASDKVELDASARVLGDVKAPRFVVTDGAKFRGKVDMNVDLPPDLNIKFKE